jgi:hypothetical protein
MAATLFGQGDRARQDHISSAFFASTRSLLIRPNRRPLPDLIAFPFRPLFLCHFERNFVVAITARHRPQSPSSLASRTKLAARNCG